ncbi:hypothetical protein F394_gp36 [Aeromonas phage vB_AsaM-56]|uniref:Lipoprotein n=1 Tax=Aeromonas phage vB_AsaM-56 TaxID=1127514 RepID=H9C0T6_9CAUD|nr:hypothetical protein F394_gp36 [Aeromonas phage vB_AsaM-56]AFC22632.1 hypothetical protein AsaM-56_0036 [Aeromonas phage vB_AsaM-56]
MKYDCAAWCGGVRFALLGAFAVACRDVNTAKAP